MLTSFRHALAFLTRLPGGAHPEGQAEIARSVAFFPLVGLLIGSLGAGVFVLGVELFTTPIAAVLCLMVTAAATGGMHEDGLADSMDALAGGWDREQRLEIFKDSRHGTFGVLALVLVSLLKFSALSALGFESGWTVAMIIICVHTLARSASVGAMAILPSARADGLGASYGRALPPAPVAVAALLGIASAIVAFQTWSIVAVLAVLASSVMVGVWAMRKIGGSTGDILGTVEQAAECAVLLSAVAVL